ncbi:hypothetical protein [Algirhabdus cladophorae]|uniref:hypothetical protein n=1 Tax=Algirhabdus cladophorae TaxID=3377108 RepID=UPI003B846134
MILRFSPAIALLAACAYTPPEASGLVGVRPYPAEADVCQVIGENDLTIDYLDHTALLIGCPKHEVGAIADRRAEGGVAVDQIGDWVLFSIPQEGL